MSGSHRSARLVQPGKVAFGATVSTTSYAFDDQNGGVEHVSSYNLIPELSFHVGANDKFEFGGRVGVAQLALEADVKIRFVRTSGLHVAAALALGIQRRPEISGVIARLPVIATYELSEYIAVVGSAFTNVSQYNLADGVLDRRGYEMQVFSGGWLAFGASAGVEFTTGRFTVQPGFELTRYGGRLSGEARNPFTTTSWFVHATFAYDR